jgi:hypothetical protein
LVFAGTILSFTLQSGRLNLAPSDFHLFTHLKQFYGGTFFGSDEETKNKVKEQLTGLAEDFYDTAM